MNTPCALLALDSGFSALAFLAGIPWIAKAALFGILCVLVMLAAVAVMIWLDTRPPDDNDPEDP